MKKGIVVCCEGILRDVGNNRLQLDWSYTASGKLQIGIRPGYGGMPFEVCPRCGKKLPFPYEEAE